MADQRSIKFSWAIENQQTSGFPSVSTRQNHAFFELCLSSGRLVFWSSAGRPYEPWRLLVSLVLRIWKRVGPIHSSEEEKTSIAMSIGKLDGGITESHGETRRQRLHLQRRSGKLRNGQRVGAHGLPHHLMNGGDFGFLEGIPENRRECRQDTHSQDTSVQYSLFIARTAHSRRLAWLKIKTKRDLEASLCTKIMVVICCDTCLINGCSLTRLHP